MEPTKQKHSKRATYIKSLSVDELNERLTALAQRELECRVLLDTDIPSSGKAKVRQDIYTIRSNIKKIKLLLQQVQKPLTQIQQDIKDNTQATQYYFIHPITKQNVGPYGDVNTCAREAKMVYPPKARSRITQLVVK